MQRTDKPERWGYSYGLNRRPSTMEGTAPKSNVRKGLLNLASSDILLDCGGIIHVNSVKPVFDANTGGIICSVNGSILTPAGTFGDRPSMIMQFDHLTSEEFAQLYTAISQIRSIEELIDYCNY